MKASKAEIERLVNSYGVFIETTAIECKNKSPSSLEPEELFEEGVVGLLKAVEESSSWSEFSGRVERKIRSEIEVAIRAELHFSKLGQDLREDFAEYRKVRAGLFQKLHRSPTLDEIVADTTLSREKLEGLENIYRSVIEYEE